MEEGEERLKLERGGCGISRKEKRRIAVKDRAQAAHHAALDLGCCLCLPRYHQRETKEDCRCVHILGPGTAGLSFGSFLRKSEFPESSKTTRSVYSRNVTHSALLQSARYVVRSLPSLLHFHIGNGLTFVCCAIHRTPYHGVAPSIIRNGGGPIDRLSFVTRWRRRRMGEATAALNEARGGRGWTGAPPIESDRRWCGAPLQLCLRRSAKHGSIQPLLLRQIDAVWIEMTFHDLTPPLPFFAKPRRDRPWDVYSVKQR